jgi:hypothetical protein
MSKDDPTVGTPAEMYPRMLQWKRKQEALDRGEDPTLITPEMIETEIAINPATRLATSRDRGEEAEGKKLNKISKISAGPPEYADLY